MDSGQRYGYSGTGRTLWVIWCCAWAGIWLAWSGVIYHDHAWVGVTLLTACSSLAAIALPVGKGPRNPS